MKVSRLSGGEQSRLLLARLMLKKTNLLVLDEPTNDLDLATLQVLEDCLADFPGAVILVTHDRYFLDRVTNRILAFGKDAKGHGTLTALAGLDQWEAWYAERKGAAPAPPLRRRRSRARKRRGSATTSSGSWTGWKSASRPAEAARDALRAESEHPAHASDAPKLVEVLAALDGEAGRDRPPLRALDRAPAPRVGGRPARGRGPASRRGIYAVRTRNLPASI